MEIPYTAKKTPVVDFIPFDGLKFKTVFWQHSAESEYKGRILFVHGFCEDSRIYTEFFDQLSDLGFDIFFFDQRGAGETSAESDHGKTNETHVFQDLEHMVKHNLDILEGKEKLILMGHSMGGGIVLNYGIKGKYISQIRAIVGIAPEVLIHPATAPNFILRAIGNLANKLMPNFRMDAGLNINYVTTNEKWQKYIASHTKKFWMSASLFHDMVERGVNLTKPEVVAKFHTPVLVVHGTDDKINWIEGTKKFYELVEGDKELLIIEGARHSIAVEVDEYKNQLMDKLVEYFSKH